MNVSRVVLLARYWNETDRRGPSNVLGTVHAHEVIADVADRFRRSPAMTGEDADVLFYNNGDPETETWPAAVLDCDGRSGNPTIIELTVITGMSDRTVIRHNAAGAEAADALYARLNEFLEPLPGSWPVELELDETIPQTDSAAMRVAIGSAGGVMGGVGGLLVQGSFVTSWANAFTLGVYDWIMTPTES